MMQGTSKHCINAPGYQAAIGLPCVTHLDSKLPDFLPPCAFSLVCLTEQTLIAVRDPLGIRPLCLGVMLADPSCYVVASEASCFELIDAKFVRDIEPGEMVIVDRRGLRTSHPFASARPRHCIFEFVYFSRPDSVIDGISVYEARKNLGRSLGVLLPLSARPARWS